MIYIDFQGGTHGNYLEFVCNKFLGGVDVESDTPFNNSGASHKKQYIGEKLFNAWHYSEYQGNRTTPKIGKIISIKIEPNDLLPLTSVSLLRAGNHGYDNNQLEKNTFNKLNNASYKWVLDNLLSSFFESQIEQSYNAVKDQTWPEVKSLSDFVKLPMHIREECINVHNLELLQLNESCPDCPRHILREFFCIGFKNPEISGFISTQNKKMWYHSTNDVYYFPFSAFYSLELFLQEIKKISHWAGYNFSQKENLIILHKEFLNNQIYKDSKQKCDNIINQCLKEKYYKFPELTLLEEAYIQARLELILDKDLSVKQWFEDNLQIKELSNEC